MILGSTIAPAGSPRGPSASRVDLGIPTLYASRSPIVRPHARSGMPTTFDKREEEFERRFAHDEELRFKSIARRNKMLGLWAAEKLGLSGADADAYAREVVMTEYAEGDHAGPADRLTRGSARAPITDSRSGSHRRASRRDERRELVEQFRGVALGFGGADLDHPIAALREPSAFGSSRLCRLGALLLRLEIDRKS